VRHVKECSFLLSLANPYNIDRSVYGTYLESYVQRDHDNPKKTLPYGVKGEAIEIVLIKS